MKQDGDHATVSGRDYLGNITLTGNATYGQGSELWGFYISLDEMTNTRLGAFGNLYERYKVKRFDIHFVGAQPTTASLQMAAYYDPDPNDYEGVGDAAIHTIISSTTTGTFKVWENVTLRIPPHRMDKWLFTNKGTDLAANTASDARFYCAGYVGVDAVLPIVVPADGMTLATVWCDFVVEFDIPQLQREAPATSFVQVPQPYTLNSTVLANGAKVLATMVPTAIAAGTKAGVFAACNERATAEAKVDQKGGSSLWGITLPAGIYDAVFSLTGFSDSTYKTLANLFGSNTGNLEWFNLSTVATALGSVARNPLSSSYFQTAKGRLLGTAAENGTSARSTFELIEDGHVDWLLSASNSAFIKALAAGAGLLQIALTRAGTKARGGTINGFLSPGLKASALVPTANGRLVEITDGTCFGWLEEGEPVPPGWWVVEAGAVGAARLLPPAVQPDPATPREGAGVGGDSADQEFALVKAMASLKARDDGKQPAGAPSGGPRPRYVPARV